MPSSSVKDKSWGKEASADSISSYRCVICGYETNDPDSHSLGAVRGNTERFKNITYRLWKCPKCLSIHSLDKVDFADIYSDYPLNERRLDIFARGTLRNLLRRLVRGGLEIQDKILDVGCGNGIFMEFMREQGFANVAGYDPYVPEFAISPTELAPYDCVVANDVIEHVEQPRELFRQCVELVKPGGLLYMGTADSAGVKSMVNLERHIMRLHQPFHRVVITQSSLRALGEECGLTPVASYRRSYMDTLMPFSNYRFLDEFNKALGHNMDLAFKPDAGKVLLRRPILFFYALFGYFIPSAYEPAMLWRKPS